MYLKLRTFEWQDAWCRKNCVSVEGSCIIVMWGLLLHFLWAGNKTTKYLSQDSLCRRDLNQVPWKRELNILFWFQDFLRYTLVVHFRSILTFWRRSLFQISAHSVFKTWVIQKPNKVALWNKRHFEGEKMEIIQHV